MIASVLVLALNWGPGFGGAVGGGLHDQWAEACLQMTRNEVLRPHNMVPVDGCVLDQKLRRFDVPRINTVREGVYCKIEGGSWIEDAAIIYIGSSTDGRPYRQAVSRCAAKVTYVEFEGSGWSDNYVADSNISGRLLLAGLSGSNYSVSSHAICVFRRDHRLSSRLQGAIEEHCSYSREDQRAYTYPDDPYGQFLHFLREGRHTIFDLGAINFTFFTFAFLPLALVGVGLRLDYPDRKAEGFGSLIIGSIGIFVSFLLGMS